METQRHLFPEFTSGSTKGQGEEGGVSVRKLSSVPPTSGGQITTSASKQTSQRSQPLLPGLLSPEMPCGATPQILSFAPSPVHPLYPSVWEICGSMYRTSGPVTFQTAPLEFRGAANEGLWPNLAHVLV